MFSCSEIDQKTQKKVTEAIDEASSDLEVENAKLKDSLSIRYENLLKSSVDSNLKAKAVYLHGRLLEVNRLIDSLKAVVKSIDSDDVEGVKAIKVLLADSPLGDSLNSRMRTTFQHASEFSVNRPQQFVVDSISSNVFAPMGTGKKWHAELFGRTDPVGASFILFGLQKELYQIGIAAFQL